MTTTIGLCLLFVLISFTKPGQTDDYGPLACEKTVADIVFVLDESGSVRRGNFEKVKTFAIAVVSTLNLGMDEVRVAVISFGTTASFDFKLDQYYDLNNLTRAIQKIEYGETGSTYTHRALQILDQYRDERERKDVPLIAIVITDGKSEDESLTIEEASKLKEKGVIMFSIGVGDSPKESELEAMANKPTSQHKFSIDNFDILNSITEKVATRTCEGVAQCICSASGGSHYKTFDGQWIHFMGGCKYTLAKPTVTQTNPSELPSFAVEIKNEHHRGDTLVAFPRLVDIKIKNTTIRLWPGNKLSVNGEFMTLPLKNVTGFSAVYSAGWIKVTTNFGLEVQFDGRHRAIVRTPRTYRNQLTGLCGDCNGIKDDFKTSDGVDVSKETDRNSMIGKSYKVFDDSDRPDRNCNPVDFQENCEGKEVNACTLLNDKNGTFSECLKKLRRTAEGYFESCKIDACEYQKMPEAFSTVVCKAYETMAQTCEEWNALTNWRAKAKCPMKCPANMVYSYNTSACQPSCSNRAPICRDGFMEGCVCKTGTLLSGDKCVPIESCGCVHQGMYLNVGQKLLLNSCTEELVCLLGGRIEEKPGCPQNTTCHITDGKRICDCGDGFIFRNGVCQMQQENKGSGKRYLDQYLTAFVSLLLLQNLLYI